MKQCNVFIAGVITLTCRNGDTLAQTILPFQLGVDFNGQDPSDTLNPLVLPQLQLQPNTKCLWIAGVGGAPSPHLQPVPARPRTILIIWVTQQFQTKQSPAGAGGRSADPAI